jgi:hypothetical protein
VDAREDQKVTIVPSVEGVWKQRVHVITVEGPLFEEGTPVGSGYIQNSSMINDFGLA